VGLGLGHKVSGGSGAARDREMGIGIGSPSNDVAIITDYPMRPLTVNVTHQTHIDVDEDYVAKDKFGLSTQSSD